MLNYNNVSVTTGELKLNCTCMCLLHRFRSSSFARIRNWGVRKSVRYHLNLKKYIVVVNSINLSVPSVLKVYWVFVADLTVLMFNYTCIQCIYRYIYMSISLCVNIYASIILRLSLWFQFSYMNKEVFVSHIRMSIIRAGLVCRKIYPWIWRGNDQGTRWSSQFTHT